MNGERALRTWPMAASSAAECAARLAARAVQEPRAVDGRRAVDDGEFDRWVTAHYDSVFRFLLARTCHEDDARDLTQESFVKAYRARHRYQPSRPLRPWLLTIAANCQRDFLRRRRRADAAESADRVRQGYWKFCPF